MYAMPRINCRNVSNPIQNQQMVNCHIFGAPGTILMWHTNLTCAVYPEEVRNYRQDNFPHKALPLKEPVGQLLQPREGACVDSTCVLDLLLYLNWPQITLSTYSECTDFL
jgi:hypothetical protein